MAKARSRTNWIKSGEVYGREKIKLEEHFWHLSPRPWLQADDRKHFAQRTLEVAVLRASLAQSYDDNTRAGLYDLSTIERQALAAEKRLSALVKYLGSDQASLIRNLSILESLSGIPDNEFIAQKDAATLQSAIDCMQRIASGARLKRKQVAVRAQNVGKLDKHAFVLVLAQAWASMTGKRPSAANRNFLRFVRSGWLDAGRAASIRAANEVNFTRAIKAARKSISASAAKFMASSGPDWK